MDFTFLVPNSPFIVLFATVSCLNGQGYLELGFLSLPPKCLGLPESTATPGSESHGPPAGFHGTLTVNALVGLA